MFKLNICNLLIILLLIGVIIGNYIWLKIDQFPAEGHGLGALYPAVEIYMAKLKDIKGSGQLWQAIPAIMLNKHCGALAYPPLSFLVLELFYILFGPQGQMVIMVNSIYIVLAIIFTYLIGKNIFNGFIGLLAVFILTSFPGFISFSRQYWIEFGLIGYVCLDIYLLLKTNLFENRKYSILLGISLALSFLHKYEFVIFLIGPLLLVIYESQVLKDILKARWSNRLMNFILVLAFSLGFSSFWWLRHGNDLIGRMFFAVFCRYDADKIVKASYLYNKFSYDSLTFYLKVINSLTGRIFSIIFILSIIFIIIKIIKGHQKRFYLSYLILSFITPLFLYTFITMRGFSHMLSILYSIAILICAGIYFIKNRLFKIIVISLTVISALNLHLFSFYSFKGPRLNVLAERILNKFNHFNLDEKNLYPTFGPPRKEQAELAIEEMLEFINDDYYGKGRVSVYPTIVAVPRREIFLNSSFGYYCLIKNYKLNFIYYKSLLNLSECDYILIENSEKRSSPDESIENLLSGVRNPWYDDDRTDIKKLIMESLRDFTLIKIYNIPDSNASIFIYKNVRI